MTGIYATYDKIDKNYLRNFIVDDSERSVSRGWLQAFDGNNRLKYIPGLVGRDIMNINEYELHHIADVNLETGEVVAFDRPRVVDVAKVIAPLPDTQGKQVFD